MKPEEIQELKQGLPQVSREFGTSTATWYLYICQLGVVVYLFSSFHRIWILLLPPICGSVLAGLTLKLQPLNPYRNFFSRFEGISTETVKHDEKAQSLIRVLSSREAKALGVRNAFVLAPVLCACLLLLARLRHPVNLSFDPVQDFAWILIGTFFFWVFCLMLETQLLLRWAFARLSNSAQ